MKITREAGGVVRVRLASSEIDALCAQVNDLIGALEPDVLDVTDPVYRRLYPDGHRDDAEAARAFRELTEAGLRDQRRVRAQRMIDDLQGAQPGRRTRAIDLDATAAEAWLMVLNDLRLAIGTRLEITDDDPPALRPGDPRAPARALYGYLTVLQDQIVLAVMG